MSRASELMDSIKFRKVMDDLIDVWGDVKSGATDEQMAEALQAVLDMAMPVHQVSPQHLAKAQEFLSTTLEFKPQRGIKALIPVPDTMALAEAHGALPKGTTQAYTEAALHSLKPKRKRRTKAEMEAARGEESAEKPLRKNERIIPPSEDENQKQAAPHIVAMLAKVQAKADAVPGPVFDVAFDVGEGMFIQELPAYLEASGKFGVLENKGLNSQSRQWVVKIGRK